MRAADPTTVLAQRFSVTTGLGRRQPHGRTEANSTKAITNHYESMIMKPFFLFVSVLACTAAFATSPPTYHPLQIPQEIIQYRYQGYILACSGVGFNADDTVYGSCKVTYTLSCGKGCSNGAQKGNIWLVSWDPFGNPTFGVQCASRAFYHPWVYAAGFDATNCGEPPVRNGVVPVLYNGNTYWVYYVSTSVDGAYELVISGVAQF
jgi:hypothetical protein